MDAFSHSRSMQLTEEDVPVPELPVSEDANSHSRSTVASYDPLQPKMKRDMNFTNDRYAAVDDMTAPSGLSAHSPSSDDTYQSEESDKCTTSEHMIARGDTFVDKE